VEQAGVRKLFVSGTASIEPEGQSAHDGDAARQVELTMRVVHAILESRGMGWADVSRAIVYVKRAADAAVYDAYCAAAGLLPLPAAVVEADVCRPELLFEIEVDAIAPVS
jgi:enamine deaminase RidA (YjgF/YER057c/UK114 family)